jgi:hypothetical protein
MKRYLHIIFFLSLLIVTSISCSNPHEITNKEISLPNSRPTPQIGELVQVVSSILPDYSLDDLINLSEKMIVGSVIEILPSQKGIRKESGSNLIYTDILITPEKYIYGEADVEPVVVRVWGGRVGSSVEVYEDEPVFTLNERVLVFVSEFASVQPVNDDANRSYYRVVGSFLGKYLIQDNTAVNEKTDGRINLTTIENKIKSVKK